MIHDHVEPFEVALMCELREVSRQGYYDWIGRPASPLSIRRDQIIAAIRLAHAESHCRYGSPNIHRDLLENGMKCCLNTVAKTMKENGIASCVHKKFRVTTTDSSHPHPQDRRVGHEGHAPRRPVRRGAGDGPGEPTAETSRPSSFRPGLPVCRQTVSGQADRVQPERCGQLLGQRGRRESHGRPYEIRSAKSYTGN